LVKILSIFVAFLENINFNIISGCKNRLKNSEKI
jgi:hypothetical protein